MSNVTDSAQQAVNLSNEDVFAGSFLMGIGTLGLLISVTLFMVMLVLSDEMIGLRFLASQLIVDSLLFLQFGVLPGMLILVKEPLFDTENGKFWFHVYMDVTWFTNCLHYPLVAWSRYASVRYTGWFRHLSGRRCFLLCSGAWLIATVQSLASHLIGDWFAYSWYDTSSYGMTTDLEKYETRGTALYYRLFTLIYISMSFAFYVATVHAIWVKKRTVIDVQQQASLVRVGPPRASQAQIQLPNGIGKGGAAGDQNHQQQNSLEIMAAASASLDRTEKRLLLCCLINYLLFALTQFLLAVGFGSSSKWMGWSILVTMVANSYGNPIGIMLLSSSIRKHLCQ